MSSSSQTLYSAPETLEDVQALDTGGHYHDQTQGFLLAPAATSHRAHPTHAESSRGSSRDQDRTTQASTPDTHTDLPKNNPWSRKNLLAFGTWAHAFVKGSGLWLTIIPDGGGVRGFSSLLILQAIMIEIARIEKERNSQATSSAYPLLHRPRTVVF